MKKAFPIFFAISFLFACSSNQKTQEIEPEISDSFKSIAVNLDAEQVKLVDAIESVELLDLEEGEGGFIAYIEKFVSTPDELVFFGGKTGEIFFYDSEGHFKSKFSHQGDGPQQYVGVQNLWLENGNVGVYTGLEGSVLKYTQEGEFISYQKADLPFQDIFYLGNGYVGDLNSEKSKYRLFFLDKKLNKTSEHLPQEMIQTFLTISLNTFNQYKDGAAYRTLMSDTLFYIKDSKVEPILHFDFGDDWLWTDPQLMAESSKAMTLIQQSEKVWAVESQLSPRYVFLSYGLGFSRGLISIIDRKDDSQFILDVTKQEGEQYSFRPLKWDGDRLLVQMLSTDVLAITSKLKPEQVIYKKGSSYEEIESSENPVLMWVKFK